VKERERVTILTFYMYKLTFAVEFAPMISDVIHESVESYEDSPAGSLPVMVPQFRHGEGTRVYRGGRAGKVVAARRGDGSGGACLAWGVMLRHGGVVDMRKSMFYTTTLRVCFALSAALLLSLQQEKAY
jgi:hypothetical protein